MRRRNGESRDGVLLKLGLAGYFGGCSGVAATISPEWRLARLVRLALNFPSLVRCDVEPLNFDNYDVRDKI